MGTTYKISGQRKPIKIKRKKKNKKEWGAREREARKDFEMTDTAWLTREKEQP